jgi:hypothetical protein
MKKLTLVVVLVALLAGCGGVWMNPEYSSLLDETASVSAETARRAEAGLLDADQTARALRLQAEVWRRFQAARDGITGEESE